MLWRVVDFQAIRQFPRLLGRKGQIQRGYVVSVEIIHNQNHFVGICIAFFKHFLNEMRPINLGSPLGDFHLSLSPKGFYLNEYICHSIPNIFVIHKNRLTWSNWDWLLYLSDQLYARFVHAQYRKP